MRQIAHRARSHVGARRPRHAGGPRRQRRAVERFLAALRTGDLQGLIDTLAPDAVLIADGGGVVTAVRHPGWAPRRSSTCSANFRAAPTAVVEPVWLNGAPGARVRSTPRRHRDRLCISSTGASAASSRCRNPNKLHRLTQQTPAQPLRKAENVSRPPRDHSDTCGRPEANVFRPQRQEREWTTRRHVFRPQRQERTFGGAHKAVWGIQLTGLD